MKMIRYLLFTIILFISMPAFSNITQTISDTAITGQVKTKIAMDQSISIFKVGVTTDHGIVKLTGNVDADAQVSSLVEMAQSIDGVKDVDASKLHIQKSNDPLEDTIITAKIKGKFIQEKLFGDTDTAVFTISVETNNGNVYLTGTAKNNKQIKNAILLAKSIRGVKRVESRVELASAFNQTDFQ
ncbi:MAG: BON domain-containing protein [Gammaproteobacteria bacterium]|nr:BON domain-containing protein [Gammaproteobacteria bacterium]